MNLELRGHKLITGTLVQLKVALTVYLVGWQKRGLNVGLFNYTEMPGYP